MKLLKIQGLRIKLLIFYNFGEGRNMSDEIKSIFNEFFNARFEKISQLSDEEKLIMTSDDEDEVPDIDIVFEKLSDTDREKIREYAEKVKQRITSQDVYFYSKYYKTALSYAVRFIIEALVYPSR